MKRTWAFFLNLSLIVWSSLAFAANSGVTYQGRILKPDGSPLSGSAVQFKIQIRTPDSGNCLMYEEVQLLNMSTTSGSFSLTINDGTGTRTDSTGWNLDRVFSNAQGTGNTFTFNPATCSAGSTYLPNASDGRSFVVYFKDETMTAFEPIPAQTVNFVPFAFEAKQIAGFTPASLVRVAESDGTLDSVSPLSNANYTELLALIAGTSASFSKINGVAAPSMSSGQVLGWNGTTWTSVNPVASVQPFAQSALPTCSAGQFLKDNGSNGFVCAAPSGGGTVTQVNTGTGLTGGGFTTTGTISIAAGGVSATELAAGAVTNAKIAASAVDTTQINAGAVTNAKLAADAVDSSKILDGSIAGADLNAAINITTSGTVATGMLTTRDFKLYPASGSFKISMEAPTLTADYQLTWPAGLGTAGQILTTDASGNLSWTTPAVNGITALTGDVTGTGPGSTVATVASVGGVTAANVASGANLANAATNANTASTIVKRDASSNFAASAITHTSSIFKDTGTNTVTVTAPTTVSTSYTLKLPTAVSGSTQLLQTDNTGQLSYVAMPAALPPSGSAGGDLSGTYPNPSVATVGGSTAANVNTTVTTVTAATAADTVSTLVKRDGSGNFLANNITADSSVVVKGSVSGSVTMQAPSSVTSWTMVLPNSAGSSGQVMQTNGSGVMTWTTPLTSATGFLNGGNSFGANASIGTNDTYRLDVKTNNVVAMTVDTAGKVGIGTTSPTTALQLVQTTDYGSIAGFNITGGTNEVELSLTNTSPGGNNWWMASTNTGSGISNGSLTFGYGGTTSSWGSPVMTLKSANVGIGTTSPSAMLHVRGTTAANDQVSIWGFGGAVNSTSMELYKTADTSGDFVFSAWHHTSVTTSPKIHFGTYNGTPVNGAKMTIDTYTGNVGIGTTAPGIAVTAGRKYLTIKGNTDAGILELTSSAADATGIPAGGIQFVDSNSSNAEKRVGMIRVDIAGSTANNRGGQIHFYTKADGGSVLNETLTVLANGAVGVGNAAPATRLDVAGTLRLGDGGETCGASYSGGVRYNGGNIQFCNGTSWATLGVVSSGTTPTLSTCGTGSPSVTGNDIRGVVTMGTASPANCTLSFSGAYASTPVCVVSPNSSGATTRVSAVSTTAFTVSISSGTNGFQFSYICMP